MRSTLVKLAALVGAGLLVLSGCATAGNPNVAVSVNGQVLSEARVSELAQAISDVSLAAWTAQQETSQPAASRTPDQQAAYAASLAQQQVKLAPGNYRIVVVGVSIQGQLAAETAKAAGITITDDQRRQVISAGGLDALSANPVTKELIDSAADAQVVFGDPGGLQAGQQVAARAAIKLNPRYGTWDPNQFAPSGTGSLSVAVPSTQK